MKSTAFHRLGAAMAIGALVASATPRGVESQQAHWRAQAEGQIGWLFPGGDVAEIVDGTGATADVRLNPSIVFGGRAIVPIVKQAKSALGRLSVGVQGLAAPAIDMETSSGGTPVGSADYYQAAAVASVGNFIGGKPITLTFNGMIGVGVSRTVFDPIEGIAMAEGSESTTAPVLMAALGCDFLVMSRLSIVVQGGVNLAIADSGNGTRVRESFPLLLGLGVRF